MTHENDLIKERMKKLEAAKALGENVVKAKVLASEVVKHSIDGEVPQATEPWLRIRAAREPFPTASPTASASSGDPKVK